MKGVSQIPPFSTPTSGTPITKFLDHPAYQNAGEIPVCPDGTFTCTGGPRGAFGRTAWTYPVSVHADYTWKLGEKYRLKAVADLFNLFNQQKLLRVNQFGELDGSPGVANPDFHFICRDWPGAARSIRAAHGFGETWPHLQRRSPFDRRTPHFEQRR